MLAFAFKNLTAADESGNLARQFTNMQQGKAVLNCIGSLTSTKVFVNACLNGTIAANLVKDHGNEIYCNLHQRVANPTATKTQLGGAKAALKILEDYHTFSTSPVAPVAAPVVVAPVAPTEAPTLSKAVKPTAATNAADITALTAMMMQMTATLNLLVERS